jgi:hypothetical protein
MIQKANLKISRKDKIRTINNSIPIHIRQPKARDYNLLYQVTWTRVILDESQIIANCETQKYHACSYLKKHYGWCLTGTPIPNRHDDILSQLKFIGYKCDKTLNQQTYTLSHLNRYVISKTMYLPPYVNNMVACKFNKEEEHIYAICSTIFLGEMDTARYARYKSAIILAILTRLRQLTVAPCLLDKYADREGILGVKSTKIQKIVELVKKAKEANEKVIVFSSFTGLIDIGRFAVDICNDCEQCNVNRRAFEVEYIERDKRAFLAKSKYITNMKKHAREMLEQKMEDGEELEPDEYIKLIHLQDDESKFIVPEDVKEAYKFDENIFGNVHDDTERDLIKVGWQKQLQVISDFKRCDECENNRILSCELSGAVSDPLQRDKMLVQFRDDPRKTVLFAQYKTGSVGLNIQCANNVVLVDPHWNNAIHKQAIARCWRFGQTKQVVVNRLFTENTIDPFILDICKSKELLGKQIIERNGALTDNTIEHITFSDIIGILNDMRYLFNIPPIQL